MIAAPSPEVRDPEDIAAMVVFLASAGGRNITGQSFNADGGLILDRTERDAMSVADATD